MSVNQKTQKSKLKRRHRNRNHRNRNWSIIKGKRNWNIINQKSKNTNINRNTKLDLWIKKPRNTKSVIGRRRREIVLVWWSGWSVVKLACYWDFCLEFFDFLGCWSALLCACCHAGLVKDGREILSWNCGKGVGWNRGNSEMKRKIFESISEAVQLEKGCCWIELCWKDVVEIWWNNLVIFFSF
jgi:hypothetical protein